MFLLHSPPQILKEIALYVIGAKKKAPHQGGYHPNIEDLAAFDFWWKLGILEKIKDANTPSGIFRFTENAAKKIGLTTINDSYDRAKFLKLVEENLARI